MDLSANLLAQISRLLQSEFQAVTKNLRKLQKANSDNSILEDWHEDMIHHLAGEVGLNIVRMGALCKQHEQNVPTLAYVARNLLELNVWIGYCCKSKQNARRFYEDRWKDGVGLVRAIRELMNAVPSVPNVTEIEAALTSLEKTLQETALTAGITFLGNDYRRVSQAADDIGFKKAFVSFNTLLSKYAHPTSMTVLTFSQGEANDRIFSVFFAIGTAFAQAGLNTINEYIASLNIGY